MDEGEKLKQMDSPFYFYAAAFVIWLGVSIGVLEFVVAAVCSDVLLV